MRILVVSDTHGMHQGFTKALDACGKIDAIFHLGDVEGGAYFMDSVSPCPFHVIAGNNDFFAKLPGEKLVEIGGKTIFMTHGHKYRVNSGVEKMADAARRHGAQICLFGHTHQPYANCLDGLWIFNPGSISLPRQQGRKKTYMILEWDENKMDDVTYSLFEL